MSRKIKNVILIAALALSITGEVLTLIHANSTNIENVANSETEFSSEMPEPPSEEMPEMPENNSSGTTSDERPEPPSGERPQKPSSSSESNEDETPPELPDGEMSKGNFSVATTASEQGQPTSSSGLSIIHIVLIIVFALIISTTAIYLIMSGFSAHKIFSDKNKIIIYILSNIIAMTFISALLIFLGNNVILSSSQSETSSDNHNIQNNSTDVSYSSPMEITESTSIDNETYVSENSDENAVLVSGDVEVGISNTKITKTGDSDGGDNTSFYGTNSAILAKSGATLNLKNLTITTDATGANGVFSYGGSATTNNSNSDGTTVNISDSTITTKKDNSGGIMTTGGGVMNATNLIINTAGTSSAAIRSDRGGGTVNVDGGEYTTTGQGSPTIYSTADIAVKNAKLVATASEGVVIEGKNSVALDNVELIDTNNKLNGQSTTYKNIFLYQSMSGDAAEGNSKFTAKNSTITTNQGDTLYVTNTTAIINLSNNKITNNDSAGNFLRIKADSWGKSGANGGDVTLNMSDQNATGNIVVDSISTLKINMSSNSYFEGSINAENSAKSVDIILDKTSKIRLTGDSYISSLEDADSSYSNIDFNGYKLYVNGTAIN